MKLGDFRRLWYAAVAAAVLAGSAAQADEAARPSRSAWSTI
jgi:hypothetical protein